MIWKRIVNSHTVHTKRRSLYKLLLSCEIPSWTQFHVEKQVAKCEYFRGNNLFDRLVHLKDVFTSNLPTAETVDGTLCCPLNIKDGRQFFFKQTCSLISVWLWGHSGLYTVGFSCFFMCNIVVTQIPISFGQVSQSKDEILCSSLFSRMTHWSTFCFFFPWILVFILFTYD